MTHDPHLTHVRFDMPEVPLPGELININGNPYIVLTGRGWSISDDDTDGDAGKLYAFVEVTKRGDF